MTIDITIAATRRPALLARTLESFSQNLLRNLPISTVHVNIDPVFGTAADQAECVAIIYSRWTDAVITQPDTASFGAAVKRLWQATSAEFVLHLEDDWILTEPIDCEIFRPFDDYLTVAQVPIHADLHHYDIIKRGHIRRRIHRPRCLGVRLPFKIDKGPHFGTSPCVMRGEFARGCAEHMNPKLDPEKQFGTNRELASFAMVFDCFVFSPMRKPILVDIGREWRDERKIKKTITNGVSTWTAEASA